MATAKIAWFGNSKDQLDAVLLEVCEEVQLARTSSITTIITKATV